MLLGIDINHPEPGSNQPSVASLVASMDGRLAEYAANVSCQTSNSETCNYLSEATENLVKTFFRKNNCYPKRIIIFRDGVRYYYHYYLRCHHFYYQSCSEGQFKQLEGEIESIKAGLEMCGFHIGLEGTDSCPVAMVVCQKRHNTRIFYKDSNGNFLNPAPGLCSDAIGGEHSISSAEYNEFYLNSHVSIQGSSKPCKYTLTYDEIGLQISEIETLAYWSSYLYCRANKSVSVAQPCYYAHWAAKRGRYLLAAGVRKENLGAIFHSWNAKEGTSMFYV
jgi:eukaryotic translation initiation factor 2C